VSFGTAKQSAGGVSWAIRARKFSWATLMMLGKQQGRMIRSWWSYGVQEVSAQCYIKHSPPMMVPSPSDGGCCSHLWCRDTPALQLLLEQGSQQHTCFLLTECTCSLYASAQATMQPMACAFACLKLGLSPAGKQGARAFLWSCFKPTLLDIAVHQLTHVCVPCACCLFVPASAYAPASPQLAPTSLSLNTST
jgi:hypothetical protein